MGEVDLAGLGGVAELVESAENASGSVSLSFQLSLCHNPRACCGQKVFRRHFFFKVKLVPMSLFEFLVARV